jgi:hypothetical protein
VVGGILTSAAALGISRRSVSTAAADAAPATVVLAD